MVTYTCPLQSSIYSKPGHCFLPYLLAAMRWQEVEAHCHAVLKAASCILFGDGPVALEAIIVHPLLVQDVLHHCVKVPAEIYVITPPRHILQDCDTKNVIVTVVVSKGS